MDKKPLPDLVVTKGGVPFADQAEGIRQFKEACNPLPVPTMCIFEGVDMSAPDKYPNRFKLQLAEAIHPAFAAEVQAYTEALEAVGMLDPALMVMIKLAKEFLTLAESAKDEGEMPEVVAAYAICTRLVLKRITTRALELVPVKETKAAPAPTVCSTPEASPATSG